MATKQDLDSATRRVFEAIEKRRVIVKDVGNDYLQATQGDRAVYLSINNSIAQHTVEQFR